MDNGQHEQLLREVLMNLERLGGDLIEKAQWARNHGLCSEPPGTPGYNNKCKFDDGLFMCVRQVPGERGRWNYVVMGRGKEITHDQPPDQIRWKPDDSEIVDYARAITPWVASIIHGQERTSRACGGQPPSLRAYGKPPKRNRFRLILLATFAGFMILYLLRTVSRNASPKSAIATTKADAAPTERPRASMGVGAQQLLVKAEKRPDPWSRSELSSENRSAMMDKARVFGVSFATVVAYEMARARVPTSRILKTNEDI